MLSSTVFHDLFNEPTGRSPFERFPTLRAPVQSHLHTPRPTARAGGRPSSCFSCFSMIFRCFYIIFSAFSCSHWVRRLKRSLSVPWEGGYCEYTLPFECGQPNSRVPRAPQMMHRHDRNDTSQGQTGKRVQMNKSRQHRVRQMRWA